ncbi:hypothetical protein EJP617_13070 [Erwinia sp. Ejp617]|nr:hypothetical protein EJP617_13070 [Erwinia sp. Ejp617]
MQKVLTGMPMRDPHNEGEKAAINAVVAAAGVLEDEVHIHLNTTSMKTGGNGRGDSVSSQA